MVVRPGQSIQAAIAAAAPGATIDVQAGTYANQFLTISRDVTLQAVGGMVHLQESVPPSNLKAAILVGTPGLVPGDAPTVTISGFEVSGVAISARAGDNGAAVRWQSGDLTLNDDWFWGNQEGLLGTPAVFGSGNLAISGSEFSANGTHGQTHGLYVGYAHSVSITDSLFEDTIAGHEIKSRAQSTSIIDSRLFGNDSTDSNLVDVPNGGTVILSGDILEKGVHSQNPRFIGYGEGPGLGVGTLWPGSSLSISHSDFVNDYGPKAQALWNPANLAVRLLDDGFWGMPIMPGPGDFELASRPTLNLLPPWA